MELQPFTDGIYSLFSQLCTSVLSQACAEGESQHTHLHANFTHPKYDILTRGLDREKVAQCLFRTTFDLILLRKWVWFNTWQTDMSPECRCLAHTYELNLKGRREDAASLEHAISSLTSAGTGTLAHAQCRKCTRHVTSDACVLPSFGSPSPPPPLPSTLPLLRVSLAGDELHSQVSCADGRLWQARE